MAGNRTDRHIPAHPLTTLAPDSCLVAPDLNGRVEHIGAACGDILPIRRPANGTNFVEMPRKEVAMTPVRRIPDLHALICRIADRDDTPAIGRPCNILHCARRLLLYMSPVGKIEVAGKGIPYLNSLIHPNRSDTFPHFPSFQQLLCSTNLVYANWYDSSAASCSRYSVCVRELGPTPRSRFSTATQF